jgi:hypothetical protein
MDEAGKFVVQRGIQATCWILVPKSAKLGTNPPEQGIEVWI